MSTDYLWLSCGWIPSSYGGRSEQRALSRENIVVGVTFPTREARKTILVRRFLTQLQITCSSRALSCSLTRHGAVAAGTSERAGRVEAHVLLGDLDTVVCIVPEVIYTLTNRRLAALKDERGWRPKRDPARDGGRYWGDRAVVPRVSKRYGLSSSARPSLVHRPCSTVTT